MSTRHQRLIVLCAIAAPIVWLFGRALTSDETFVYRDAAHFYYPLYQSISQQWGRGELPLWNPHENGGQPLLADATSAALYPAKLLFALPLSFAACYKLYIVGHVALAAGAAYMLARRWELSPCAAAVSAIAYSMSGSVVFQYCNIIFLVGAAWLPLAMLFADDAMRQRSGRGAVWFALVLAMMVLGGDPQSAYHALLAAALYALLLWSGERALRFTRSDARGRTSWLQHRLVLLAIAVALFLLLSTAQLMPSFEWGQRTERAQSNVPRNLLEFVATSTRQSATSGERLPSTAFLLGQTAPHSHHAATYEFSVGPWHLVEFVWPNVSGEIFPINKRWINVLPGEGRTWTPTLYFGLLPFLLAVAACRFRNIRRAEATALADTASIFRRRWLTWLALIAVFGSFGLYGLGWLAEETLYAFAGEQAPQLPVGKPFGGIYWLMQTLLPGYIYFRYPAKLLVPATLALSLLAGFGWEAMLQKPSRRWQLVLGFLASLSLIGAAGVVVAMQLGWWKAWLANVPPDSLFGPLDTAGAGWGVVQSLLHTSAVSLVLWAILRSAARLSSKAASEASQRGRWQEFALVAVVAIDLAVAQQQLAPTAPVENWTRAPLFAAEIERATPPVEILAPALHRVYRARSWTPPTWRTTSSPNRQLAGQAWDQASLLAKYQLPTRITLAETAGSASAADWQAVWQLARRRGENFAGQRLPHPGMLAVLNVDYVIAPPTNAAPPWLSPVPTHENLEAAELYRVEQQLPRAFIVHHVELLPPSPPLSPQERRKRTEEVFFPSDKLRDFANEAVVEAETVPAALLKNQASEPQADECEIEIYRSQEVQLRAKLSSPGLLVLSEAYDPNWRAEVFLGGAHVSSTLPVLRTNRVLRGVAFPAGEHRVVLRYRPTSVYVGLWISTASWLSLAALLLARRLRRNRNHLHLA